MHDANCRHFVCSCIVADSKFIANIKRADGNGLGSGAVVHNGYGDTVSFLIFSKSIDSDSCAAGGQDSIRAGCIISEQDGAVVERGITCVCFDFQRGVGRDVIRAIDCEGAVAFGRIDSDSVSCVVAAERQFRVGLVERNRRHINTAANRRIGNRNRAGSVVVSQICNISSEVAVDDSVALCNFRAGQVEDIIFAGRRENSCPGSICNRKFTGFGSESPVGFIICVAFFICPEQAK